MPSAVSDNKRIQSRAGGESRRNRPPAALGAGDQARQIVDRVGM